MSRRNYHDAITQLTDALSICERGGADEPGLLHAHADLVEAFVRAGRSDQATALTARLETYATQAGRRSLLALAARCRGLIAPPDLFAEHFGRALELHDAAPEMFQCARTELCLGERLHRVNRRAELRAHLRRAADAFDDIGAASWATVAATALRAAGGERRRPESGGPHDLTRRELDVARLVAKGATNKEVAIDLFVNEKTVEYHLGNVYRKLGFRSRSELARAFATDDDGESG